MVSNTNGTFFLLFVCYKLQQKKKESKFSFTIVKCKNTENLIILFVVFVCSCIHVWYFCNCDIINLMCLWENLFATEFNLLHLNGRLGMEMRWRISPLSYSICAVYSCNMHGILQLLSLIYSLEGNWLLNLNLMQVPINGRIFGIFSFVWIFLL